MNMIMNIAYFQITAYYLAQKYLMEELTRKTFHLKFFIPRHTILCFTKKNQVHNMNW